MSIEDRDQRELEAVLQLLESSDEAPVGTDRELLEVMGFIARSLTPVRPPSGLKQRLMTRVRGRIAAISEPTIGPPAAVSPVPFPAATTFRPQRAVPLHWAVAAGLVALTLFAGLSFLLLQRLQEQERRVARLETELSNRPSAPTLEAELAELRADLSVMTSTKVSVCALESQDDAFAQADGIVYLTPGGGRWVLSAQGLKPNPSGRSYRIWFVAVDGVVKGGDFHVTDANGHVHFCADAMPADTKAIMITLEPESDGSPKPQGPTVLYGRPHHLL